MEEIEDNNTSKRHSLSRFFSFRNPFFYLIQKSNHHKIINFYLLILIIFSAIDIIYTSIKTKSTSNSYLTYDVIKVSILMFLFLLFSFTTISKLSYSNIILGWLIYITFFFQTFISLPSIKNPKYLSTHKTIFNSLAAHVNLFIIPQINSKLIIIHCGMIFTFDIIISIFLSVKNSCLLFESLYIIFIFFFLIFAFTSSASLWLSEYSHNQRGKNKLSTDALESLNLGYLRCRGEKFEVIEYNRVIKNKYSELIQKGAIKKKNENDFISNIVNRNVTTQNSSSLCLDRGKSARNRKNSIFPNVEQVCFFDMTKLIKPIDNNNMNDDVIVSLKDTIAIHIEKVNKSDVFNNIGGFHYENTNVNLFIRQYKKCESNISKDVKEKEYEFILTELSTAYSTLILSNYDNILKKISHEFRTPIIDIQKIIEGKIKENDDNSNNTNQNSLLNKKINFSFEELLTIKFLSEISLLIVRDIIEYSNLLTISTPFDNIPSNKKFRSSCASEPARASALPLSLFVSYLYNLSQTYLYMMNKNIDIIFQVEENVKNAMIVIDEQKLKQIISNLITNAIKISPLNSKIIFIISLLHKSEDGFAISNQKLPQTDRISNDDKGKINLKDFNSERFDDNAKSPLILGLRIALEDSGQGLSPAFIKFLNSNTVLNKNDVSNYAEKKGISSGLRISKKLCDEMGIEIKSELLIKRSSTLKKNHSNNHNHNHNHKTIIGTRISLDIFSEIILNKNQSSNIIENISPLDNTNPEINNIFIEPNEKTLVPYDPEIHSISTWRNSFSRKEPPSKRYSKFGGNKKPGSSSPCIRKISRKTMFSSLNIEEKEGTSYKGIDDKLKIVPNESMDSEIEEMRIFLVDDDRNIADTIKNLVTSQCNKSNISYRLKVLSDGIELLYEMYMEFSKNSTVNKLVLCDEMMRFLNGSETFDLISKFFGNVLKNVVFVSISAFSDEFHKKKLEQMGIKYIYEKPLKRGHIEYIFNNIIKDKFG